MALSLFDIASASTLSPIKASAISTGAEWRVTFRAPLDERNFLDLVEAAIKIAMHENSPFAVYWRAGEIFIISGRGIEAVSTLGRTRTSAIQVFNFNPCEYEEPLWVNHGLSPAIFEVIENIIDEAQQSMVIDAEFDESTLPVVFDSSAIDVEEEPEEEIRVKPVRPEPVLSEEQEAALATILRQARTPGSFTFVTGKAGTGKSTVFRAAQKHLNPIALSPTGLAAYNIGGQTIHSFFGFRFGPLSHGRTKGLGSWKLGIITARPVIFIDEFGMVRADVVDAIDKTLRRTPGLDDKKPFGGIPIVAFGDPFQLEPIVQSGGDKQFMDEHYQSPFFFDAHVMREAQVENIVLSQVFRQSGDSEFVDALNGIRKGDRSALDFFNENFVQISPKSESAVRICFKNATAKQINAMELSYIEGDMMTFQAEISGDMKESDYPNEEQLRVKVGAQVMVCKNIFSGAGFLANGQVGTVTRFIKEAYGIDPKTGEEYYGEAIGVEIDGVEHPIMRAKWEQIEYKYNEETKEVDEEAGSTFTQFPLKLAWAITAHKSQGQTLPEAHICMDCPAFAHGQLYVALSRVSSRDGLSIGRKLTSRDLIVNPAVQGYDLLG